MAILYRLRTKQTKVVSSHFFSTGEAEGLYSSCLRVREGKGKVDTLEVASVLAEMASMYFLKGDSEAAEDKARRALVIGERILGSQHPKVGRILVGKP